MPSFCRHNRLVQNCPICAREQELELRPVVTPGGRPEPRPRVTTDRPVTTARPASKGARARSGTRGGMTVRRLARAAEDGYASDLVPGVRSVADAERLAEEIAFAVARLDVLAADPPGLYAEVAAAGDLEERTWLAFQIAFACPLDADAPETPSGGQGRPFAGIQQARRSWASGEAPALQEGQTGPRNGGDPARGARTSAAYRSWAQRLGSQAAGIGGEATWSPRRRFDRICERLGTLASMERAPRYDMLVTLGRLGVYELAADRLHLGGSDPVTLAAKRILGIGDPLLLERRAIELAEAAAVPIEALDLGFFNWERGERFTGGLPSWTEPDPTALGSARAALGVSG